MSLETLEKTVITDNWQFFSKKLFQNFFHHKKILKATKLQIKIICRPRVVDKNMPLWYIVTPLPSANRLKFCFLVLTLPKVLSNVTYCSRFCTTKLDSFYNTLDLYYFHRVSLICSAYNMFLREVIIIHCKYIEYIYIYIYIYIVLVMYPEIFIDNTFI